MREQTKYPLHRAGEVAQSPDLPALEKEVLAYWEKDQTFQASIDSRTGDEFVFYDGPPFANGLPHYGHLLTGYVKDVIGRYQTMNGKRVERRFGWDTHGLPAELEAQRELGIDDVTEITRPGGIGIAKFNDACRSSVMKYANEWQEYVTRQARWVDFANDYKTLDLSYMESVMWAFKTLYDRDLIYKGYQVLPYCWNDQTPLSNHELKMDDEIYQDRQDNTVTVAMRLTESVLGREQGEMVLIWTTTPWTLPANLAVAVGPEIEYVAVQVPADFASPLAGETVILGAARLAAYAKELGEEPQVLRTFKGSELVGKRYYPIFDYFDTPQMRAADGEIGPHAWKIIGGDYVTVDDGTGLVHIAPAFGEDDMLVAREAGIGTVVPVDEAGCLSAEIHDYAGLNIFAANKPIIADLRDGTGALARINPQRRAILVQQKSYVHSYPHCWRCRKPLIYKAVSSWFVKVTAFRERMVELNQQITWQPAHIKDGIFGNWLANARDWSISRNRFWGAPIPVWISDNPAYPRVDVYGSIAELERDFGVEVTDLHRPFIDTLTRPNPDDPTGMSKMVRVPEVLDCWFESGSMPYAQVHYPFENRQWFESHYPGDFIVEYIGQTRGWFYTMHVLATALFDCPAFTSCISHGIVLGNDGRKASKSLRNYPDPMEMYDKYGADAVRWMLMSSPVLRGGNLVVAEDGIREAVRHVILPLWNTYYFFGLYAGTVNDGKGYQAQLLQLDQAAVREKLSVMDRYLLARTKKLADDVRAAFEQLDIPAVSQDIRDYLDLLTNWYVRTSRDRFWNEDLLAFDTLYTILETLTRVLAPLAPLVTEEIWRGLTGGRSVHLQDWPVLPEELADLQLVSVMDEVREVVSHAHSLRKANKLRVRQPLQQLTVVTDLDLAPFAQLIAAEVNVRNVAVLSAAESGLEVNTELTVLPRELDPQIRRHTSALFKAAKAGAWEEVAGGVLVHIEPEILLQPGQYELSTTVAAAAGSVAAVLPSGSFVVLDTVLTPELEAEGYARDLIRLIQDQRKAAGLHVSDRIVLSLRVPDAQLAAVEAHLEMIQAETLSRQVELAGGVQDVEIAVQVWHGA